MADIEQNPKQH